MPSQGAQFNSEASLTGLSLPLMALLETSLIASTLMPSLDFNGYDLDVEGITFRLGGEPRMMSLLEFRWRVRLYFVEQSMLSSTKSGLRKGETVKADHVLMQFWLTIGDDEFVVGGMAVKKVQDPRVRLAHHCITTTILGRKESTQRITLLDLFFLYCIYDEGVTCIIPYSLAHYLERFTEKDLIVGGMFVTKIARSFGLLTNLMVDALIIEHRAHVGEDDEVEEAADEEVGGSAEVIFDAKKHGNS
ncbi:hypothetical protein Tco_0642901 [Tanacetum coccineum]